MEYRVTAPRAAVGTFPYRDHRTQREVLDRIDARAAGAGGATAALPCAPGAGENR